MPTLSYENKDKTPMNIEKEKYLKFYNKYVNSGAFLATTINVLEYFSTHEKDIEILQKFSPNFYNIITYSLWAQAVIVCNSFFAKDDDMSFYNFFEYVSNNFENIFTGKFYLHKHYGNRVETELFSFTRQDMEQRVCECRELIDKQDKLIEKIRTLRNKLYAHFSNYKNGLIKGARISLKDLKTMQYLINDIIDKINVMYDRKTIILKPINATDIYQVLTMLKRYDMFHEEIADMYQKKIEEDISNSNN